MTSPRICTAEMLLSTTAGLGPRLTWFPRIVAEAFLESKKDGEIKRSPDPVTMIDGGVTWFNNSPDNQGVVVQVVRAPRSIVAQSPGTVIIHDAWAWDVRESPSADYPSVMQDAFGGRAQIDRATVRAEDAKYGRVFIDGDSSQAWVNIGTVPAMQSLHFRYLAAVQTPGAWVKPSEFDSRYEAHARWTRLLVFAGRPAS